MSAHEIVLDRDLLDVLDSIHLVRHQALQLLQQQEHALRQLRNTNASVSTAAIDLNSNTFSIAKHQSRLVTHVSHLRGLYRRSVMTTRSTKQLTSDAREDVDNLHLQLQNMTYEQSHLKGEIAACEGFAHQYVNLTLVPVDEFLSLFPEKANLAEHDLTIARIEHEHAERQALEEKRQGLLKRKQGLIAENNRRKEDLANLDQDLEKFIEAADPIIKTFEREY